MGNNVQLERLIYYCTLFNGVLMEHLRQVNCAGNSTSGACSLRAQARYASAVARKGCIGAMSKSWCQGDPCLTLDAIIKLLYTVSHRG